MRYTFFDLARETLKPAVAAFAAGGAWSRSERNPLSRTLAGRVGASSFELAHRLTKNYPKKSWAYPDVVIDGKAYPVHKTTVRRKAFGNLLRFSHAGLPADAPKILFVAALSGHHATLAKETYQEFLPDHDVYVTDWLNARDIPLAAGRFGFDDYVAYLVEFLEAIGPDTHMFGICQAAVPTLVATSVMSREKNPCRPRSLALMAGPIDIRVNPSRFSRMARRINIDLLRRFAIHTVPSRFEGAGRRVYPGAQQLFGFMSMNPGLHLRKHAGFFRDVVLGNDESAARHREFYDEYFALLDTTEEFYLETLERVFRDQLLPKGEMTYYGEPVSCEDITDVPVLTLEGEDDEMVMLGQTAVALELCRNLPAALKEAYVQPGVGHYGIFNGERYRRETAPRMKQFFAKHGAARKAEARRREAVVAD